MDIKKIIEDALVENTTLLKLLRKAEKDVDTNPTDSQIEYGNYSKGHIKILGFDITIENPKGSVRSGVDDNGKKWSNKFNHTYGYFKRTEGKDGDEIDVFIGEKLDSNKIFVVDQFINNKFDESKVMLGFETKDEAKKAYLSNYEKNWNGFKYITEVDIDVFKEWLYDNKKQRKAFHNYKNLSEIKYEFQTKNDTILIPYLNEYQYKEFISDNKSNKKNNLSKLLYETSHHHEFLEPINYKLLQLVKNTIHTMYSKLIGYYDEIIDFNIKYCDKIHLIINLHYLDNVNDLLDLKLGRYGATYHDSNGLNNETGNLKEPTFRFHIPYYLKDNEIIVNEENIMILISHEVTHMYDDWLGQMNGGDPSGENQNNITNNELHHQNEIIKNIFRVAYFASKIEQKAFIQQCYSEFKKIGLNQNNYKQTMKETQVYKHYLNLKTTVIPYIENINNNELHTVLTQNKNLILQKGIPFHENKPIEEIKSDLLKWAENKIKTFFKKFGGILTYYLDLNLSPLPTNEELSIIGDNDKTNEQVYLKSKLYTLNEDSCKITKIPKYTKFNNDNLNITDIIKNTIKEQCPHIFSSINNGYNSNISPLNEFQFNHFISETKSDKKHSLLHLINESGHYHQFLEPLNVEMFKILQNIIKYLYDNKRSNGEDNIQFDCEYTKFIHVNLQIFEVENEDILDDKSIYIINYYNSTDFNPIEQKLNLPTFNFKIPYFLKDNELYLNEYILETAISHEITHMYDDWQDQKNGGKGISYREKHPVRNGIEHDNEIVHLLCKTAYFNFKPEQKAFVQQCYTEFKKIGLNVDNYKQKMKETWSYKNYEKVKNEYISKFNSVNADELVNIVKGNWKFLEKRGVKLYNPQSYNNSEEYKQSVIKWCENCAKMFFKKFGGIVMEYLQNNNKPNQSISSLDENILIKPQYIKTLEWIFNKRTQRKSGLGYNKNTIMENKIDLPDIKIGDEIKIGKFKNKKATIEDSYVNDKNQPMIKTNKGDKKVFNFDINEKLEDVDESMTYAHVTQNADNLPMEDTFEIGFEKPKDKKYVVEGKIYNSKEEIFNRFETLKQIGKGSNGIAYLTPDNTVLKITDYSYEASLAQQLLNNNFKHIINVYEVGQINDSEQKLYYIIMEYLNVDKQYNKSLLNKFEQLIREYIVLTHERLDNRNLMDLAYPQDDKFFEFVKSNKLTDNVLLDFISQLKDATSELSTLNEPLVDFHEGNFGFTYDNTLKLFDNWSEITYDTTLDENRIVFGIDRRNEYKINNKDLFFDKYCIERNIKPEHIFEEIHYNILFEDMSISEHVKLVSNTIIYNIEKNISNKQYPKSFTIADIDFIQNLIVNCNYIDITYKQELTGDLYSTTFKIPNGFSIYNNKLSDAIININIPIHCGRKVNLFANNVIYHEVEHLYQDYCILLNGGINKLGKFQTFYNFVESNRTSENDILSAICEIYYYSFKSEQDAFLNQIYQFYIDMKPCGWEEFENCCIFYQSIIRLEKYIDVISGFDENSNDYKNAIKLIKQQDKNFRISKETLIKLINNTLKRFNKKMESVIKKADKDFNRPVLENKYTEKNDSNIMGSLLNVIKKEFEKIGLDFELKEDVEDFKKLDDKNIYDNEDLLEKYGLKRLVIQNKYGLLELSMLASKIIGSGAGTKLLNDLCEYADSVGKPITLTPAPLNRGELEFRYSNQKDVDPITKSRLTQYYEKFGFVPKQRNDGYITTDTMIRYPKKNNTNEETKTIKDNSIELIKKTEENNNNSPNMVESLLKKSRVFFEKIKQNKMLVETLNKTKINIVEERSNFKTLCEKKGVSMFDFNKEIEEIIKEIKENVKKGKLNGEINYTGFNWVENIVIKFNIHKCINNTECNLVDNNVSYDNYNDTNITNDKLEKAIITLTGSSIGDNLIVESIEPYLYHELNHVYQNYQMLLNNKDYGIFQQNKNFNYDDLDSISNYFNDDNVRKFVDIIYWLIIPSERNAHIEELYDELKSKNPTKFDDLFKTKVYKEFELIKDVYLPSMFTLNNEYWFVFMNIINWNKVDDVVKFKKRFKQIANDLVKTVSNKLERIMMLYLEKQNFITNEQHILKQCGSILKKNIIENQNIQLFEGESQTNEFFQQKQDGGYLYYVTTEKGKEKLRQIANAVANKFKRHFPDAKVDIKEMDYHKDFGITSTIDFDCAVFVKTNYLDLAFTTSFRPKISDGENNSLFNYLDSISVPENERGNGYAKKALDVFSDLHNEGVIKYLNTKDMSSGFWGHVLPNYPFIKEKYSNGFVYENDDLIDNEQLLTEVEPDEISLKSFKPNKEINQKLFPNNMLNSKVRLKLLGIADDFIETLNVGWVKPEDIVLVGSIVGYNWSKYSDIDLHIVMDLSKIDDNIDFVKEYLNDKKNLWNKEHEDLKIFGFPIELYVEDINEPANSNGRYSLETNAWIDFPEPNPPIQLEKYFIKQKSALLMTKIDELENAINNNFNDKAKLGKLSKKVDSLWNYIKNMRKSGIDRDGETSSENYIFKILRRKLYLEKLANLKLKSYNIYNSIYENNNFNIKTNIYNKIMIVEDNNTLLNKNIELVKDSLEQLLKGSGKVMQNIQNGGYYLVIKDNHLSNSTGKEISVCVNLNDDWTTSGPVYIKPLAIFKDI